MHESVLYYSIVAHRISLLMQKNFSLIRSVPNGQMVHNIKERKDGWGWFVPKGRAEGGGREDSGKREVACIYSIDQLPSVDKKGRDKKNLHSAYVIYIWSHGGR